MYKEFMVISIVSLLCLFCNSSLQSQRLFRLNNAKVEVVLDEYANLHSLINLKTGTNYASGKPIWRLYYDNTVRRDMEVKADENKPIIQIKDKIIHIDYVSLIYNKLEVNISLSLRVFLEDSLVRFSSSISNNASNTVIRELQYPLVGNCFLPIGYKLLNTYWGGQLYEDPRKQIKNANAAFPPYYPPSQYFLQMDTKYPQGLAANCFAFVGSNEGVYFGSHDTTFQDTGHGLRLYPNSRKEFNEIEAGFYKYPNCLYGETWNCSSNVISPYTGTWHETSKIYRQWANSWWIHRDPPNWVKEMKGWQRIILKHQYGEVFFPYSAISSKIKSVGETVGINTAFIFGWWKGGMDNDNPNYSPDESQGGAKVLKNEIAEFKKNGGKILWYYNGRLIDKASDYYIHGEGKIVSIKDNTGAEVSDSYKFRGPGTFTGSYDSRTFAVADLRNPLWKKKLYEMSDQAITLGANSVFYDQLGGGDQSSWDLSKQFPIPNLRTVFDKASILNELHNYIDKKDTSVALGIEILADVTANQADYVHARYGATEVLNPDWSLKGEKPRSNNFIDWFRYTFPEVILSDRDIRDDSDIERRVNHTVLKGLRNDIEIYRCRALIDETPNYQMYLSNINRIKEQFKDLLLLGKYIDTEGVIHSNPEIEARRFVNKDKSAIVLTQSHLSTGTTNLKILKGYRYLEEGNVGNAIIKEYNGEIQVILPKHALAVLVFKKI